MSREIKFRAWDEEINQYRSPGTIQISYDGKPFFLFPLDNGSGFLFERLKNIIIEQFTGLTDKNGKEIYEGDIVYFRANYTHKPCGWMLARIVYSGHKFVLSEGLNEYEINDETDGFDYQAEVRGNIHENPELLNL